MWRKQGRFIAKVLRWSYGIITLIYSTNAIAKIDSNFKEVITNISTRTGFELNITSGYRSPTHPLESVKEQPGDHSKGLAIDFSGVYINVEFLKHGDFKRHSKYELFVRRIVEAGFLYINEGDHSHIANTPTAKEKLHMAVKGPNGLVYSLGKNRTKYFETVTKEHPDYNIAKELISHSRK